MKKKMHIKYDLSGNKKDDIVECLIKDNIITYFDDDYKMKIDLNKEKIIIKYNNYEFDKRIKIIEKKVTNSSFSIKYLLVDEDIINFYEIK